MVESLADLLKKQREAKLAQSAPMAQTQPSQASIANLPAILAKPTLPGLPPKPPGLPTKPANALAQALATAKTAPLALPKPAIKTQAVATPGQVADAEQVRPQVSAEEFQHSSQPDTMSAADEESIRSAMQFLEESFQDPQQLKQAIQKVMADIQAQPELAPMLFPEDVGLCVRALREAHGTVVVEKELTSEKKIASAKKVNDVEDFMKGFGGFKLKI